MNKLIEEYSYKGKGYEPFLIRPNWQVAQLNYMEGQGLDDIEKIDIHFNTDEAFILIEGQAILITAKKDGYNLTFHLVEMKEGIVYNVPMKTWHNIAMSKDAQVIIIEDANTHLGDFEFYHLNDQQKFELHEIISSNLKDVL